jgi:hypothetical protein
MKENNDILFYNLLMNDDIIEQLIDTYIKIDKARASNLKFDNSCHWKIILTKEGKVEVGYFKNYATRIDIHEGRAIQIATIDDVKITLDDWSRDEILDKIERKRMMLKNRIYNSKINKRG